MFKVIKHLLPLFVVQFFTWLALFALWIYATPVITKYVFATTNADSTEFENGTSWVGICFAYYSTLAALLAFYIPKLLKKISKETLHTLALFAGGIGLLTMYFIKNKFLLFFSFTFIGIAWSSISTVPYTIISAISPPEQTANYFAVFNFSVVIPQVVAAFLLGYINKHFFYGETIYVILFGGCCMFLASLFMYLTSSRWVAANTIVHE